MLKKYYITNEAGNRIFVGYKVKSLESLNDLGYHISRTFEEDFLKARKRGTVYISHAEYNRQEREASLFNNQGLYIATAYKNKDGVKNDQRKIGNPNFRRV